MINKTSILILENLRSIENTASIFRTADAFSVSKIILVGTTPTPLDRFRRKRQDFAKVSLGAEESVSWERIEDKDLEMKIGDLKDQGLKIIALEQTPNSKDLKSIIKPEQFAVIVGNEVEGVSEKALALSDIVAEIPMMGMKESLNVSVAAGVALFVLS